MHFFNTAAGAEPATPAPEDPGDFLQQYWRERAGMHPKGVLRYKIAHSDEGLPVVWARRLLGLDVSDSLEMFDCPRGVCVRGGSILRVRVCCVCVLGIAAQECTPRVC